MHKILGMMAFAIALAHTSGADAQAQSARPPAEAYGSLPETEFAAISPDGTKIAFARNQDERAVVAILDIAQEKIIYAAGISGKAQLRGVGWIDNERAQVIVSQSVSGLIFNDVVRFRGNPGRLDLWRSAVANITTRRMQMLTTDEKHPWSNTHVLTAPIDGDPGYGRMIGWTSPFLPNERRIFRINLDNSNARAVSITGVNDLTDDIIVDPRGAAAARVDIDDNTNQWTIYGYVNGTPRQLLQGVSRTGNPDASPVGVLPDQRLVIWDNQDETDRLLAIDRTSGAQEVLYTRGGGGLDGVIVDTKTGYVVGVDYFQDISRQHFFDAQLQALADKVAQLAPNADTSLASWSRDRSRAVAYIEKGLDGGGFYLLRDGLLSRLGMRYPLVAEAQRVVGGERQAIKYRARDNTSIPAMLTLPSGERRNLPLVLLVHGGPSGHDDLGFDWWSAFLASRGYAVLQPNFRGSDGYGKAWQDAGLRQWGGLMQADVEDGVAALIRTGMVDPNRVCIIGASYGGYAALAGATLTPDRYRCAVSVAGVSDLDAFVQARIRENGAKSAAADYWRLSIGDRAEDRDAIRAVSPVNLVDRVRIPILLIHGTDDAVVPIEQSRAMDRRLRGAGKDVRLVVLRGDDHYLSDSPTRTQMLAEIETFLAANLAGK